MDERIDIEVIDKVAKTIKPELLGISQAAKSAHPEITKLKNALSGMNFSGMSSFRKMATDANALSVATTKLSSAQTKAAINAHRLAQEEAKTALIQERVRTQAARTLEIETRSYLANERALNQAVASENKAIGVKNRLASASEKAAAAANKEAASASRLASVAARAARSSVPQGSGLPTIGGSRSTVAAQTDIMRRGFGRVAVDAKKAGDAVADTGVKIANTGKQAQLSRHHLLNLGFQLQDLFVSLQAGQNPLTVFIQQGGQIGQISAQAGVGIGSMAKAAGGILLRALTSVAGIMASVAVVIGTVTYAVISGSREFANYANQLSIVNNRAGLTAEGLYVLSDNIAENAKTSSSSIRSIAAAYATSGKFSEDSIKNLTEATNKFSKLTGQASADVVKEWQKMADGPTAFAVEMSETYDLLSAKQIQHIRLLEQEGQRQKATDELTAALNSTLKQQAVNLGYLQQAWNSVATAISNAWDWLMRWGAEAGGVRPWSKVVSDIEADIVALKKTTFGLSGNASIWDQITGGAERNANAIAQAEAQLNVAKQWASVEERRRRASAAAANTQREGIAAQARLTELTERHADDSERAQRAINAYRKDIEAARAAGLNVPTAAQQAQTEKALREQFIPSLKAGKSGKTDAERLAERQGRAIRELNADIARESALLSRQLVGIDAVIAERMAGIEDSLDGVSISLRDSNGAWTEYGQSILEQVTANELAKKSLGELQSAYSSLYNQAIQPADDWVAATNAASMALKQFAGDADKLAQINRWLAQQQEAYLNATNPMREYNMAMEDQRQLLQYYGRELEIQTEIQRRYNEQKALDPSITPDRNQIGSDVRSDMRKQGVQGFLGDIDRAANDNFREGGNQWLIDNYEDLYSQIQAKRDADLAHADEYNRQLAELDRRYIDARLSGAATMFDNLATLQNSSVREIAAIGKAAAIAQATIDGIRAVQAALAGPPGPPWSFGIAATVGVATAANVAKIAGIGFQKGGYTGDMPTSAVAGAVHGREYVFDAPATARIGIPALEALRNGRLNPGPAANNNGAKVTVINNAGADVQVRERSDGELEIVVERALARKMGPMFERRLTDPNSRESRAIGTNYKTRRNR